MWRSVIVFAFRIICKTKAHLGTSGFYPRGGIYVSGTLDDLAALLDMIPESCKIIRVFFCYSNHIVQRLVWACGTVAYFVFCSPFASIICHDSSCCSMPVIWIQCAQGLIKSFAGEVTYHKVSFFNLTPEISHYIWIFKSLDKSIFLEDF